MKIEEENKADTKPDVQDEVHASPNTNQLRELGAFVEAPKRSRCPTPRRCQQGARLLVIVDVASRHTAECRLEGT
jgi:hypothetical protein